MNPAGKIHKAMNDLKTWEEALQMLLKYSSQSNLYGTDKGYGQYKRTTLNSLIRNKKWPISKIYEAVDWMDFNSFNEIEGDNTPEKVVTILKMQGRTPKELRMRHYKGDMYIAN